MQTAEPRSTETYPAKKPSASLSHFHPFFRIRFVGYLPHVFRFAAMSYRALSPLALVLQLTAAVELTKASWDVQHSAPGRSSFVHQVEMMI
jgi:hypothetical protein